MYVPYDIGEEVWVFQRPSVAEMKHQYEEMVARLKSGDPRPFRSNNIEKIMYLRRKRLQDQVPTQDKRPKVLTRFSLSIPLTLQLKEPPPLEKEDSFLDLTTNIKKIDTVEEWWSDFHSHNTNLKYIIQLGSLSIGDQAILELSSKLNDLVALMPGRPLVPSMDVSWNDIYEEGMIAFSGLIEKLSGLQDIRMDGNQMGTAGLEALLNAVVKAQPQEKKRSAGSFQRLNGNVVGSPSGSPFGSPVFRRASTQLPGVNLTLRETNIGDDSTTCLANFLKPLPDNKQLNLVSLDLTNTYIFDGITALTLALQQNTVLTALTLNSNMIGDQGAFAIGELFLTNRTLAKLDIRNCDIGPTGTSHLCEGLQGHQGLRNEAEGAVFSIDVGLNPWEFSGELLLLQTALAKPKMSINWREGDWTPTEDQEMKTLISTFGEAKIMERIMDGKGLLPLASPTQLIESPEIASYAPVHVTTTIDTLKPPPAIISVATNATATSPPVLTVPPPPKFATSAAPFKYRTSTAPRKISSSAPASSSPVSLLSASPNPSSPTTPVSSALLAPPSASAPPSPKASSSPTTSSSDSAPSPAYALLNTIILIMQTHGKTSYRSWMAVLPTILTHLCSWMTPVSVTHPFHRQIEVSTLELISILGGLNQQIIEDIVVKSGIIGLCLDNFLAYPNHNVFHLRLTKLVESICTNTICGTLRKHTLSLLAGDFFNRLLNVIKSQSTRPLPKRTGAFSASLMFIRVIEPYLDSKLGIQIKKAIKQFDDEQKGSLGGPPPERGNTKIVLNKDAEI